MILPETPINRKIEIPAATSPDPKTPQPAQVEIEEEITKTLSKDVETEKPPIDLLPEVEFTVSNNNKELDAETEQEPPVDILPETDLPVSEVDQKIAATVSNINKELDKETEQESPGDILPETELPVSDVDQKIAAAKRARKASEQSIGELKVIISPRQDEVDQNNNNNICIQLETLKREVVKFNKIIFVYTVDSP